MVDVKEFKNVGVFIFLLYGLNREGPLIVSNPGWEGLRIYDARVLEADAELRLRFDRTGPQTSRAPSAPESPPKFSMAPWTTNMIGAQEDMYMYTWSSSE
jgi:hypothetical protein